MVATLDKKIHFEESLYAQRKENFDPQCKHVCKSIKIVQ